MGVAWICVLCPFYKSVSFIEYLLVSGNTRCSKFILCFHCPRHKINNFSKECLFLLLANSIKNPDARCTPCYGDIVVSVQTHTLHLLLYLFVLADYISLPTYKYINHEFILELVISTQHVVHSSFLLPDLFVISFSDSEEPGSIYNLFTHMFNRNTHTKQLRNS